VAILVTAVVLALWLAQLALLFSGRLALALVAGALAVLVAWASEA
jgi:hypothetical protein